ncbi:MAG: TIGR03746 family integrating conjugative element protein [Burkholderiales bacterium]|nr:MAG: TIGR03746 family integrating conjugative element protein [Burkholderiales bacterium]
MARYVDALEQARWTIKIVTGLAAAALLVAGFAVMGWRAAPKDLDIHIPPDLSAGATIHAGRREVPSPNVYTFAFYIWQQLNRWSKNGQQDYGDQIYKLQAFFTPSCREQLIDDQKIRADQGELDQRTRTVTEIPGLGYRDERVVSLADGSWAVMIDTQIQETSRGVPVKDAYIRYPLHIVRYDVDRERNPWQLALDCFRGRPERLDPKAVEVSRSSDGSMVKNTDAYANKSLGDGGVDVNDLPPTAAGPAATPASAAPSTTSQSAAAVRQPLPSSLAPAVLPRPVN